MAKDVLITPASGIIEFYETAGNLEASIELDNSNNLIITGNITLGDAGGDVYIGDGVSAANIVFEQGGAVYALATKTLTLGIANSFLSLAANITSGANVTGNVTAGNLTTAGLITATGNITGGNLSGTSIAGTLTTAAQTNITSVGTLGSLAVTGNTTSGNFIGTLNGSGANISTINATNISSGTLAQARLANASVTLGSTPLTLGATVTTVAGLSSVTSTAFVGALTGAATTAGTVTTAAQPNITSVGTLTSLTVTGNVSGGNLTTAGTLSAATAGITGNITTGNILTDGYFFANGTPFTGGGGGGGTPGGSNTQVQFNDGGVFGGTAGLTFNKATNALSTTGTVSATGNVSGGNLTTAGLVSATGNVTGGNLTTGAQVVATGNVTGGNLNTAGRVVATGNITGGNLLPPSDSSGVVGTAALTWNNGQFTNFTVDTTLTAATINVSVAVDLADDDILRFGTSDDWEMYHTAGGDNRMDLNTGNLVIRDDGTVGDPTRFTFGRTTGDFTATGNVTGGNLTTAGLISATGNITGGNILGNGAGLTGINVFSNISVSGGNSVVADSISDTLTLVAGDGITITANATSDTITFSTGGGSQFIFETGGDMGLVTESPTSSEDLGLVTDAVIESYDLGGLGIDGVIVNDNIVNGTITGNKFASDLELVTTGNITAGNISVGNLSATGNITGNYVIGNSGVDTLFFTSPRTISANTTVANINAMTAGPITIADGVTVTVSSGGEWTIV